MFPLKAPPGSCVLSECLRTFCLVYVILRAPLSAGYLWLAAGWLYFAPQLPASAASFTGVMHDVYRVVVAASPTAIGVGLSFVAYMVGILSTGLLTRPVRVIVMITAFPLFLPLLLLIALLSLVEKPWPLLGDFMDQAREAVSDILTWLYTPAYYRVSDLVTRELSNRVLAQPTYREALLDRLSANLPAFLRAARRSTLYSKKRIQAWSRSSEENQLREVRDALSQDIMGGYRSRAEILVKTVVDTEKHVQDILDELHRTPERLIIRNPNTYERWDRLNSEAEFRQAIVPPLIAIIAVIALRGAISLPASLVLSAGPLAILIQGIRKEYASQAQLIQAIEAGVIDAATVTRLSTTDLYWRVPDSLD